MKNTQLYLISGIPTLTVILTAWAFDRQRNRLCAKIDQRDKTLSTRGPIYTSLGRSPR